MKTIGVLGTVSVMDYARVINDIVNTRSCGTHSAKLITVSCDMQEISDLQHNGEWDRVALKYGSLAKKVLASADFVVLASNTANKIAQDIAQISGKEILRIDEVLVPYLQNANIKKIGLLGKNFVMRDGFYAEPIIQAGIEVIVPDKADCYYVHNSICDELGVRQYHEDTKRAFVAIMERLCENGAEAILLGSVEIGGLLQDVVFDMPIYNGAFLHARAAAYKAIGE